MKFLLVISLVIVTMCAAAQAQDVGVLLMDSRIVHRGINCILNRGPCDAIGIQIKGLLPEVLKDNCRRCKPQQAKNARKLIEFMRTNYPHEWRMIDQTFANKANNLG